MKIENLQEEILNTAVQLIKKGMDASPSLRTFQNKLNQLQTSDPNINFLCFFLYTFVDDIYFNLTGDVPYKEASSKIINSIFKSIGKSLQKIGEKFNKDAQNNFYEIYVDMVQHYRDGLTKLSHLR
jgi:hypothetical protein